MKKVVSSSVVDVMLKQSKPYDVRYIRQLPNGNHLFEGHPKHTGNWITDESIEELIQLVEGICNVFDLNLVDGHVVGDDEFIIFEIAERR